MRPGIIFGLVLAASYRGQPSILVITGVDSAARYPLVNADVIDLTSADHGEWGRPDYAQSLLLEELKYRKETPPGYEKGKQ